MQKLILDVCCGGRGAWFPESRNNRFTVFGDCRKEEIILCNGQVYNVNPDIIFDVTALPFKDNVFQMVFFDPPHLQRAGEKSWLRQKYGILPRNFKSFLRKGLQECVRVLKPKGILIFKWSNIQINLHEIMDTFPAMPLFGTTGGNRGNTRWITFMKHKETLIHVQGELI